MPTSATGRENEVQRAYSDAIDRRIRSATAMRRMRSSGIQILWLIVVAAGAGVPLNQSLDGPDWVTPALGFVVVVSAGVERIFQRTTIAAVATDDLGRRLAHERRLFAASIEPYSHAENRFEQYVERSEAIIREYDERMIAHGRTIVSEQH